MTRALQGVPAAPGAAIGVPWIYRPPGGGEDLVPLDEAAALAAERLSALADRLRAAGRDDEAGILDAQALMALDPELLGSAQAAVAGGAPAADSILRAGEEQAAILAALDDETLAARAADVRDVAERIARVIRGQDIPPLERASVALAVDLPPSVTAELDPALLVGIALEAGSPTAHAAILARALGIPAVVGVAGLLEAARLARLLAVDGDAGEVTPNPGPAAKASVETKRRQREAHDEADVLARGRPLATADGHRVMLGANIGRPEDAAEAAEGGAEGIGLFRTEFMFMGRSRPPTVDVQTRAYAQAFAAFPKRPVVVRTLDIGGDKQLPYVRLEREENPFLGVRAIRLAAGNRALLVDQLRAILGAAATSDADTWIMAPMVADSDDVALVRALVDEARGPGAAATPRVKLGIMVEVPAAALVADQLARLVDFFSIGTNDLTQYLLAVDRTNPALASRQDPMHPAVLRAVRDVVAAGHAAGIPVAVCGEMAGDPAGAVVLAGLGVDELSMDPRAFGAVKRALGALTLADIRALATAALDAASAGEARQLAASAL